MKSSILNKTLSIVSIVSCVIIMTSCGHSDMNKNESKNKEIHQIISNQKEFSSSDSKVIIEKNKDQEIPSFEDRDEYMAYIAELNDYKPHYKTVFRFENLSDLNMPTWQSNVVAMYNDIKESFNYHIFKPQPLYFVGDYNGEDKFLDGYIDKDSGESTNLPQAFQPTKNELVKPGKGKAYKLTVLKAFSMGENTAQLFDKDIAEGRNFNSADFKIDSIDEPISIILGSSYGNIYKIGDILKFGDPDSMFNYKVIGFYKSGVGMVSDYASSQEIIFDNYIIAPHYIPTYEPSNEAYGFEKDFQIGTLLDGNIYINEPIEKIDDELYESYKSRVIEIAKKHGLENMINIARLPADLRKR